MIDWDTIKNIWPIGVILVGFGVRMESNQAVNKHRISALEEKRKEDKDSIHKRIDAQESMMSEIRSDVKDLVRELLKRG